jgi:predicted DNA-binding transcriptional regulator YafY
MLGRGYHMAKGANQKLKILYLMKILLEKTDETHSITMPEILSTLEAYGVNAERKSIYDDFEALRLYGMDIIGEQRNKTYYYRVGKRDFELAELKLLVDAVQSSKFVTAKKTNDLIRKIENLASKYEASKLQRQVYVAERIKTMNESIYYNVDKIHSAIGSNVKIKFQYFQWNLDKTMELRKNGEFYCISPWALSWDNENYYLVGYDCEAEIIKHYRVDKMLHIDLVEEKREGKELFEKFDIALYAKRIFGMYDGEIHTVKLECENRLVGVIIDRFGKNIKMVKLNKDYFTVSVEVAVSLQFIAWVIGLGQGAKVVGPGNVVYMMEEEVRRLIKQYL